MRFKDFKLNSKKPGQLGTPHGNRYLARLQSDFEKKATRLPKPPPSSDLIENMRMTSQVYQDIKNTIGSRPAESGGLLMSHTHNYTITCYVHDIAAAKNSSIYQPDTEFLNSVLKGRNDEFVGIAHSHARGARYLSSQDQRAAWSNMTSRGNPHLCAYLMPLIQTIPDTGRFEIIPFIVTCHAQGNGRVEVCRVELEIMD